MNENNEPADQAVPTPIVSQLLAGALEGLLSIASESVGVSGYHLNDDVAEWGEFEEVEMAEEALKLYETQKTQWVSVSDCLPERGVSVIVYSPDDGMSFDLIDEDCDDGDRWYGHGESYDHYCSVAMCGIEHSGPSEEAPYTHWMLTPEPPKEGNE